MVYGYSCCAVVDPQGSHPPQKLVCGIFSAVLLHRRFCGTDGLQHSMVLLLGFLSRNQSFRRILLTLCQQSEGCRAVSQSLPILLKYIYIPENADVSPERFLIVQCLHNSQIFRYGTSDLQSHALTMLAEMYTYPAAVCCDMMDSCPLCMCNSAYR